MHVGDTKVNSPDAPSRRTCSAAGIAISKQPPTVHHIRVHLRCRLASFKVMPFPG